MKYLSFHAEGRDRFGFATVNGVFDLSRRTAYTSLRDFIARGRADEARLIAKTDTADYALAEITFLTPLPDTDKIVCVGVNYPDRNAEYKDGSELPKYPSLFLRTRGSFVAHGQPIQLPPESSQLDYEGEIALVIGKPGRRISEDNALDHIFGLTLCNEGSVRDWMRHGKFNVTQGKNFEASGSIGPWIVPIADVGPLGSVEIKAFVNGELRQEDKMERMMFPVRRLISYISNFTALLPGDIIVSGTPTGSGARFDPPRYLVAGDVVAVESDIVGRLENRVELERA
ncbi:fumarylacetoacetate hydrolase family protein [Aureimonas fodinaquatilis]|uniref:Fumarylacetoacetate hydrolase family protein n=1 Tax=Aureimonas fodinaquatilis TaxID=2565783 RepID=A0A5B0DTJ0_9HYPH|nr:fumarylacetoacetate hydrolase family protein [Aureimonas fodinaquatilis]KAA0969766.1 fumarylacetoacetate hydrolase family protein [Aureimonas fodinaquatilis]